MEEVDRLSAMAEGGPYLPTEALEEAKKAYEAAMRQAEADAKRNADNAERAKERAGKEAEEKQRRKERRRKIADSLGRAETLIGDLRKAEG